MYNQMLVDFGELTRVKVRKGNLLLPYLFATRTLNSQLLTRRDFTTCEFYSQLVTCNKLQYLQILYTVTKKVRQ